MGGNRQETRSARTRGKLVAAARALFAVRGYAATGTEDIVAKAGVTRGALYHHFHDKRDLLQAVVDDLNREVAARIDLAAAKPKDLWQGFMAGCEAFLDASLDPEFQRIVLLDAPAAIGWEMWRELDARHGTRTLKEGVEEIMREGLIPRQPVAPLTHLLAGALNEAALVIAQAPNPRKARVEIGATIRWMLDAMKQAGG